MSGANTQPASACGDGADAVDLLAPWQAPPSLKALPSLETPPSQEAPPSLGAPPSLETPPSPSPQCIIATEKHTTQDLLDKVHSYLASARSLSQELKNLRIMQQMQCTALERRIEEYYEQAYIQSELIAIQGRKVKLPQGV